MLLRSEVIVISTIAIILGSVNGWKPISIPPASFTIRQSHPALGSSSQHSRNSIGETTGGSDRAFSIFDTDHRIGGNEAALLGSSELSDEYRGFKSSENLFSSSGFGEDACSVDKYAFDHEGTVHYRNKMPKLDQFTICFWMRFTNHSGDHTLFTYSVDDETREIQIWVANSMGSSYISMAVHGQSLYRLNYPLKMRMWHHACTSWNGKTGEWQLWVKTERVGRGFHNRLVSHSIPAHGILFSGGPSITGPTATGLHFEMTLLQIYKVALTAGKAHRDHKHHHVHQFNHDGAAPRTTPAPPTNRPQQIQVMNPLLANGQIPTRIRINLAGPQPQMNQSPPPGVPSQVIGGGILSSLTRPSNQATINTNFINGQFHTAGRLLSQQLVSNSFPQLQSPRSQQLLQQQQQQQQQQQSLTFPGIQAQPVQFPGNIQFVDAAAADSGARLLFKRESSINSPSNKEKLIKKRELIENDNDNKKITKRGLVMLGDGTVIDDTLLAHGYQFEGLAQFGLPAFQENLKNRMNIEDEIKEHDKEPAEDEVKAVMAVCTSCDEEPFKGAIAIAWQNVIVSLDQTLKGRSVGGCGYF